MAYSAYAVASAERIYSEVAYCVPYASLLNPVNPIPTAAVINPPGSPPTGLVATNVSPLSFTLSWTGVIGAIEYLVTWSTFTAFVPAGSTTYTLTNLSPSTTANALVTAINGGGTTISAPLSVTTGAITPTGLAVSNITSTGFLCTWNAQPNTTYTLSWGAFNGTVTGPGQGSFTGLPGQTTNNLVVTADGTVPSAPLSVTTAPSAPTGFAVTRRGTNYLNISWTYVAGVTYSIVLGSYTGTITGNGTGRFANLPVGYSATGQITATNVVGSSSVLIPSQTLLGPINFDTGPQNQLVGAIGFSLAPLNPGTFTVPTNFDILNNGTPVTGQSYVQLPQTALTGTAGFDYGPAQVGGLFALRFASTSAPNPVGSGGPGDSWQNEYACYTTGNQSEFSSLTNFTGTPSSWNIQPGDTITCFLLIAYGGWFYRTFDSIVDPTAMVAFWRIQFTYNPFSLT